MNNICYLIPSNLMTEVTEHLDRAGVCFHVADREDLAEAIAKGIIHADGKEFVPVTAGEYTDQCRAWGLFDKKDGSYRWKDPLTREDAAILAVRLIQCIEKGVK